MRAVLLRAPSDDQGTPGILTIGDRSFASLELPWRENTRQISCIPAGLYACRILHSPRFGRVYGLAGVPGRSNILIHSFNFAGDVAAGWQTQSEGCIGLGRPGWMQNVSGKIQRAILLSRMSLSQFMRLLDGAPFDLEVRDGISNGTSR